MDATRNHANERVPAADCQSSPGSSGRPIQFSLGALMLVMTLLAPLIAAASGSLGDAMQYLAAFLFVATCLSPFFLMLCCPVLLAQWIENVRSARRAPPSEHQAQNAPSQWKSNGH